MQVKIKFVHAIIDFLKLIVQCKNKLLCCSRYEIYYSDHDVLKKDALIFLKVRQKRRVEWWYESTGESKNERGKRARERVRETNEKASEINERAREMNERPREVNERARESIEAKKVHATWSQWKPTSCSKTCGSGQRTMSRYCSGAKFGGRTVCPGSSYSPAEACNVQKCPECRAKTVKNAVIVTHKEEVSVAEKTQVVYQCNIGYGHTSGDIRRTCTKDSTLNGSDPICTATDSCHNSLTPPMNGYMACTGNSMDSVCLMKCKKGSYEPLEKKLYVCNANTEWKYKVKKGDLYERVAVGKCQANSDSLEGENAVTNIFAFIGGDSKPPNKTIIANEMKEELKRLGICKDNCKAVVQAELIIEDFSGVGKKRSLKRYKFSITIKFTVTPSPGGGDNMSKLRAVATKIQSLPKELKRALLDNSLKIVVDGTEAVIDSSQMKSHPSFDCKDGFVRNHLECYPCPSGTWYDSDSKTCKACQINHYQSDEGRTSCLKCAMGTRTLQIGSHNLTDCIEIDNCVSNPCQNNGNCTDKRNGFDCFCQPGFTGKTCETDIDFCAASPCTNGGTCVDEITGFKCQCKHGFVGTKCETFVCPNGYLKIRNTCYQVSAEAATYNRASMNCAKMAGGRLAVVNSKKIYKTVTKICDQAYGYWIGLNDIQQEGKLVFSDGSLLSLYNQWHKGSKDGSTLPQPDDKTHQQNCVAMVGTNAFDWFDESCDQKNRYVCEVTH